MKLFNLKTNLTILFILFALLFSFGCGEDEDDATKPNVNDDDDLTDDDDIVDDDDDDDDDDDSYPDYPNDDILRVNHIQMIGTHNSYHLEPALPFHSTHRYSHKPLDEQLDIGVRQFELDVYWVPGVGLKIFHIPVIDQKTTCDTLVGCLDVLKTWSDKTPGHHPIIVFLEPKVVPPNNPTYIAQFETDILEVWPKERILTPDDVRGEFDTLHDAITAMGWPTLGQARDKIIIHAHNGDVFRDNYMDGFPNLEERLMFVDANVDDSFAAILPMNNPIGDADAIEEAVLAGFIVRTRAGACCDEPSVDDYTRFEAALSIGAHAISTDFPVSVDEYPGYFLEIPDGNPSRCNPLAAPVFCVSEDIENLPK